MGSWGYAWDENDNARDMLSDVFAPIRTKFNNAVEAFTKDPSVEKLETMRPLMGAMTEIAENERMFSFIDPELKNYDELFEMIQKVLEKEEENADSPDFAGFNWIDAVIGDAKDFVSVFKE